MLRLYGIFCCQKSCTVPEYSLLSRSSRCHGYAISRGEERPAALQIFWTSPSRM